MNGKVPVVKLGDPYAEITGMFEELEKTVDGLCEIAYNKAARLIGEFPQEADPPAPPQSVEDGFLGNAIRKQNILHMRLQRCIDMLHRI